MTNDDNKINEDYRRVLATANKLETIQGNLESVIDFFLLPVVKLSTKLCNDCFELLFRSDFRMDQFRKAEELVWRRIYHDLYRFQKTKRHLVKKQDEHLIESHFLTGIGFYSSLIVKLRIQYKIFDVPGVSSPLNFKLGPFDNFTANEPLNNDDNYIDGQEDTPMSSVEENLEANSNRAQEWARQSIYRSLVYMGDLARYLLEISHDYRDLAFEFYKSASRYQPEHGLPFNQLATLAGGLNYNLDAVCSYMRCCLRPRPFEGAEGNMRKVFELNKKHCEELRNSSYVEKVSDVYSSKDPGRAAESMVRAVIINFIKLTSDIWSAISIRNIELTTRDKIVFETSIFFELMREALDLESIVPLATSASFDQEFCPISNGSNSHTKPKYLSPTIVYELCNIALMLIAKCHKVQASNDSSFSLLSGHIVGLANTLALKILRYTLTRCQNMIISKVQELRVVRQELTSGLGTSNSSTSGKLLFETNLGDHGIRPIGSAQRSTENLDSASDLAIRRAHMRSRQKKAATKYTDSNPSSRNLFTNHDEVDMSELEETALSTIDALDISSDMSEETANDLIDLGSSSDNEENSISERLYRPLSRNQSNRPKFYRPTKSQNYELDRKATLGSTSSLPVPDLLTGDDHFLMSVSSQSPSGSLSESEPRDKYFTNDSYGRVGKNVSSRTPNELEMATSYIYTQTYLPTIKIFCDWLLANSSIITADAQYFVGLCDELKDIVTMLDDLKKLAVNAGGKSEKASTCDSDTSIGCRNSCLDDSVIFSHTFDGPHWVQKYPLSCDHPLYFLEPLKSVHESNINFGFSRDLTDSEAGFLTIECISAFTHALTAFLDNKTIQ